MYKQFTTHIMNAEGIVKQLTNIVSSFALLFSPSFTNLPTKLKILEIAILSLK